MKEQKPELLTERQAWLQLAKWCDEAVLTPLGTIGPRESFGLCTAIDSLPISDCVADYMHSVVHLELNQRNKRSGLFRAFGLTAGHALQPEPSPALRSVSEASRKVCSEGQEERKSYSCNLNDRNDGNRRPGWKSICR